MLNPTIDKALVTLIIGPVIGILVMKGYIAPTNADQATQLADSFLGALITIITIVSWFAHHTEVKKTEAQKTTVTGTPTTITLPPSASTNPIATPPYTSVTTPSVPLTQPQSQI